MTQLTFADHVKRQAEEDFQAVLSRLQEEADERQSRLDHEDVDHYEGQMESAKRRADEEWS